MLLGTRILQRVRLKNLYATLRRKTGSRGGLKTPKTGKSSFSGLWKSTSWIFFCISWIFLFLKWMPDKYIMDFSEIDVDFWKSGNMGL